MENGDSDQDNGIGSNNENELGGEQDSQHKSQLQSQSQAQAPSDNLNPEVNEMGGEEFVNQQIEEAGAADKAKKLNQQKI